MCLCPRVTISALKHFADFHDTCLTYAAIGGRHSIVFPVVSNISTGDAGNYGAGVAISQCIFRL
jgi:hypothetical protein